MVRNLDHLTIVVGDVQRAMEFFGILGFRENKSVVISGEPFASYMGVPNIKADHVTLVLEHASPRTEVQLLRYHNPEALPDDHIRDLHKIGMNRICWTANLLDTAQPDRCPRGTRVPSERYCQGNDRYCAAAARMSFFSRFKHDKTGIAKWG